jgi:hypothetical protein
LAGSSCNAYKRRRERNEHETHDAIGGYGFSTPADEVAGEQPGITPVTKGARMMTSGADQARQALIAGLNEDLASTK